MTKLIAALLLALIAAPPAATGQTWPSHPVKIVVPFGPGSTPDLVARLLAERLQQDLGQPFTIENKAGASGITGTDAVARAEPDGYTIGVSIGGPLAINALLFSRMPYDTDKDIDPVTQLVTQPSALAVPASLGIKTVSELIALIKAKSGQLNFGSIGNGSLSHLTMEAIALSAGGKLVHLPYPSSPAAMTALIRGDVQMACLPAISVQPHALAGKVTMLAVSTARRSSLLPSVPTLKESGIDVEADAWMGLIAPAGTPAPIVARLNREVVDILQSPAVKERLSAMIMEPVGNSPAEFRARIMREKAIWQPVIQASGVKIN